MSAIEGESGLQAAHCCAAAMAAMAAVACGSSEIVHAMNHDATVQSSAADDQREGVVTGTAAVTRVDTSLQSVLSACCLLSAVCLTCAASRRAVSASSSSVAAAAEAAATAAAAAVHGSRLIAVGKAAVGTELAGAGLLVGVTDIRSHSERNERRSGEETLRDEKRRREKETMETRTQTPETLTAEKSMS